MHLTAGTAHGSGFLTESEDPAEGNDSFPAVTAPEVTVWDAIPFNGFLYVGLEASRDEGGFSVLKTDATGTPPYSFTFHCRSRFTDFSEGGW